MRAIGWLAAVAVLAGCVPTTEARGPEARASLVSVDGSPRGSATIRNAAGTMRLTINATGLTAGPHGLHIHAVGKCDGPDFHTAGGHWNPTTKQHGRDNPMGAHHGDLPNIEIGADGTGAVTTDVPGTMAELMDADGASIIIHAVQDDYKTDPTGNSGGRVACGVFSAG
jgi:superoxide dismutase, Cu-Zn family